MCCGPPFSFDGAAGAVHGHGLRAARAEGIRHGRQEEGKRMLEITKWIATLVAAEFVYIFILETVMTTSDTTAKALGLDPESLKDKDMQVSMKNQGVYNLGIAGLSLMAAWVADSKVMLAAVMVYIVVVAAYGSMTVSKSILVKQGGFAIVALLSMIV